MELGWLIALIITVPILLWFWRHMSVGRRTSGGHGRRTRSDRGGYVGDLRRDGDADGRDDFDGGGAGDVGGMGGFDGGGGDGGGE